MASYHRTNLGAFGSNLPVDRDGYTYTTIPEWLASNQGADLDGMTAAERHDWAREMAKTARAELAESEAAVADWRNR